MTARRTLRRVHLWLAWIAGVPLLFWTLSGLWMSARPIEEVRGTALRAPVPALILPTVLVPPRDARTLTLAMQGGRPVWLTALSDGREIRADVATGRPLPPVTRAEAARLAQAARATASSVTMVTHSTAASPPVELRRERPAWGVAFADGVHVFVDADTGAILALRSEQWRWYDWMWGLHIMDLGGREATHHALLIAFAAIALVGTIVGLVLLPLASRRRRR